MDTVGFYIMMGVFALIGLIGIVITSIYNYVEEPLSNNLEAETLKLKNTIHNQLNKNSNSFFTKIKTKIKRFFKRFLGF